MCEVFGVPRLDEGSILPDKDFDGTPLYKYEFTRASGEPAGEGPAHKSTTPSDPA